MRASKRGTEESLREGNKDATIHTRNPRCRRWRSTNNLRPRLVSDAVSFFAALGTFGNFALNLGTHFKWW
jgi:hypothetical protein